MKLLELINPREIRRRLGGSHQPQLVVVYQ